MKKYFFPFAAVAAMAISCQTKDLDGVQETSGQAFTIEASITATKTSYEAPFTVTWDENETLSVIACYSDGTYDGYRFIKEEGNTFTCPDVHDQGSITGLKVFYPYSENMSYAEGYGTEAVIIGSPASGVQTQNGADDTGHVDAPLYGQADAESGKVSQVQMRHASTLFEVIVANNTGAELDIEGITLSNSDNDNMTGAFFLNPESGELKPDTEVSASAVLEVLNGAVAAGAGSEGRFYIVSAPFELPEGGALTVTVTTADGSEYEVEKVIPEAGLGKFEAGKVNHINVPVGSVQEAPARIFVDFGLWKDGRVSEDPWNNLTSFENHILEDENGEDSGASIDLTNWTGANKFEEYYTSGFKTADDIVFNGITFPQSAFMDWLLSDKKDKASFVIEGLDPDVTYEITTASIRWNSASNVREMSLDIKGSGEAQNSGIIRQGLKCGTGEYETPDDWASIGWSQYFKAFTLKPAADGTVTVTLNATEVVTSSTVQQAHLNAMVITPLSGE